MHTPTPNPAAPAPTRRRVVRRTAMAAVAVASVAGIWAFTGAPAEAGRTSEPQRYSAEFTRALARYADAHGLSGVSPASLSPTSGCHGLSLASATDCTDDELEAIYCAGAPIDDPACTVPRP
jgi:hypothetical protein